MPVFTFLLLLLGFFEIISNLIHLAKKSKEEISKSAKRQHQEIPLMLANNHFFEKPSLCWHSGFFFWRRHNCYC